MERPRQEAVAGQGRRVSRSVPVAPTGPPAAAMTQDLAEVRAAAIAAEASGWRAPNDAGPDVSGQSHADPDASG